MRHKAAPLHLAFAALALMLLGPGEALAGGAERAMAEGPGLLAVLLACRVFLYLNGVDELVIVGGWRLLAMKTLGSLIEGALAARALSYVFPVLWPGATTAVATSAAAALILFALRPALRFLVRRKRIAEGTLIVGAGGSTAKFYRELVSVTRASEIEALIATGRSGVVRPGTAVKCGDLREVIERNGASRIVVAEPTVQRRVELTESLIDCKFRGVRIEEAVNFYEKISGKIWLDGLRPEWLLYSEGFQRTRAFLWLKRFLDIACALLLLMVTAPVAVAIAFAIKLGSHGPILFRQVRVGLYGKIFVLYKFRSMQRGAETGTGPIWAGEKDTRATSLGKFLRKFHLDEIPQVLNVLRGEMSVVGPRPERPHFVNLLERKIDYYELRQYIKPGITGWAQVTYPYGASVEDAYEKLQYDLYYAKHMSLGFDVKILLKTVKVVLFGRGR